MQNLLGITTVAHIFYVNLLYTVKLLFRDFAARYCMVSNICVFHTQLRERESMALGQIWDFCKRQKVLFDQQQLSQTLAQVFIYTHGSKKM